MPIKRKPEESGLVIQQAGREIGQLRSGMTTVNANGKKIPTSIETIRYTTRSEESAESLAEKYNAKPKRVELANGQKTIEVMTDAKSVKAIVPPGGAAMSQWREMWGGRYCKRRCDGETESKSQSACMCPLDAGERKALAAQGQACKDTTRVNLILPDVVGLGVWRLTTNSYFAGIELEKTVEFLANLSANGLPLWVTAAIDMRDGVLPPSSPSEKPQTVHYPVWTVDPEKTANEIAAIANTEYGMRDALVSTTPMPAIDAPKMVAIETTASMIETADSYQPASEKQKSDIRIRINKLTIPMQSEFSDWWTAEQRDKRLHALKHLAANEVQKVMDKLNELDPVSAEDDEVIDAEFEEMEMF